MLRLVLDTSVLVAGLRSKQGAAFRVLELVGTGVFEHCVSVSLVLEYEEVLRRQPEPFRPPLPVMERLLDYHCETGHRTRVHFRWRPFLPDPGDDMVLETAVAAGSQAIVTYNQKDFAGVERFGIVILTPGQLLHQLGLARKPR
jgi:putative PIN family toxin of toxin-antitoxin system